MGWSAPLRHFGADDARRQDAAQGDFAPHRARLIAEPAPRYEIIKVL